MNINRNFIIIFGVSMLLIITIFGLKTYYEERGSLGGPISYDVSFKKVFDQNYPTSLEETISFNKICADVNEIISTRKQEFEPLLCTLEELIEDKDYNTSGKYTFMPSPLKNISNLLVGQYIAIAVNYSDLLQKNASTIPADSSFNLCTITEPVLLDPFREELLFQDQININRNVVFSEGEVFCSKFFGSLPSKTLNLLISGFVPSVDLFQAQIYLILEDEIVNDIFSQESFSDIKEILKLYPLLWNTEKPLI